MEFDQAQAKYVFGNIACGNINAYALGERQPFICFAFRTVEPAAAANASGFAALKDHGSGFGIDKQRLRFVSGSNCADAAAADDTVEHTVTCLFDGHDAVAVIVHLTIFLHFIAIEIYFAVFSQCAAGDIYMAVVQQKPFSIIICSNCVIYDGRGAGHLS